MFVFVSDLCHKLRYTLSWLTLSVLFSKFGFSVVSQAVCNEWDNNLMYFLKGIITWFIFGIFFRILFFYFLFSTLDGCCIGYFRSSENNKCESKIHYLNSEIFLKTIKMMIFLPHLSQTRRVCKSQLLSIRLKRLLFVPWI